MTNVRSRELTAEQVGKFPEATIEEAWACFEVFRRWGYPSEDIYTVLTVQPAPHVCVVLMEPGTQKPRFNLYAGKVTQVPHEDWLTAWKMFAAECSEGHVAQERFNEMWTNARVHRDSVGLVQSMMASGLTVQKKEVPH